MVQYIEASQISQVGGWYLYNDQARLTHIKQAQQFHCVEN